MTIPYIAVQTVLVNELKFSGCAI